ncbi:ABC transporter substrate-binding protein [Brachybacterium avium]|uniref:ABC transporter substrate-binding protein n=1 Tax=Brachybacterium avium TaxID=2017485 RepID=A0A220UDB2_9MICO|nr:ABC transporter substrate-binding protein [Brachybacterium avium]ASK66119.1 ABC transporter substrate-binding protein [Brachybacterium avium]
MTSSPTRRTMMVSLVGALGLAATACTASDDGAPEAGGGEEAAAGFPLTLTDCDAEVVLPAAPERVVLLDSAPVTTLDGLGVLDRVVARAGSFPEGYYDADLAGRLEAIPVLSEDIDTSGHLQISQEVVIAQRPDLVLGLPDGVTREGMRAAGAEVLMPRSYCGGLDQRATFTMLFAEITAHGAVFDRTDRAEVLVGTLQERIDTVASLSPAARTAAVLYPSVGGGPLYAYGALSMATAQLDALGIQNVFADTAQRVFESGTEPLLASDPDLLIVLHQGTVPVDELLGEVLGDGRLASLRAARDGAVLPLLFNFTEPASPLIVDGLERIGDWLSEREQER